MRIAVVHSFYRSVLPSGENRVVLHQVKGLQERGHDVLLVRSDSDDLGDGAFRLSQTAWRVARHSGPDPSMELERFQPEVVHVHNLFPNFGSQWLERWDGPLVATLHNYRSVCASAVLSRDGHLCTLCPDGHRWGALRYRCYRGSFVGTLPMAWRTRQGVAGDPVLGRADRLVVLSESTQSMFERFGVPPRKMTLIPNGVPDPGPSGPAPAGPRRFAAVGRLSPEKGFQLLLRDWPAGVLLDVVGDGPQAATLQRLAPIGVRFLGLLPHDQFLAALPKYAALVVPGANPEGGYPMVTIEALAAGVPLVARRGGVVAPMVAHWQAGAVFSSASDLPAALDAAADMPSAAARAVYRERFTESGWLDQLEALYLEVLKDR